MIYFNPSVKRKRDARMVHEPTVREGVWILAKHFALVAAGGLELEPFCRRERSGSLQAKS